MTGLTPSAVRRAPLLIRDQVANYLRDSITSLQLTPGTVLIEREICEATSASRTSVREALRLLESEGLVRSEVGRGSVVHRPTLREAREIYEVRVELECFACKLFSRNASAKDLAQLSTIVDRMADLLTDPVAMVHAKAEFYEVLFAGAGNTELRQLSEALRRRTILLQVNSLSREGRPVESLRELRALTEALRSRNAELASRICEAHINKASEALMETIHDGS